MRRAKLVICLLPSRHEAGVTLWLLNHKASPFAFASRDKTGNCLLSGACRKLSGQQTPSCEKNKGTCQPGRQFAAPCKLPKHHRVLGTFKLTTGPPEKCQNTVGQIHNAPLLVPNGGVMITSHLRWDDVGLRGGPILDTTTWCPGLRTKKASGRSSARNVAS